MSRIRWLSAGDAPDAFPSARDALEEPNGLLAAGGDLSVERLLCAYRNGIFPWYEEGQPILWWSPDPRAVLRPQDVHVSRSLRRTLRKKPFELRADAAFADVVAGCAAARRYGAGTWITAEMARAYGELHRLGWAHSFEAWQQNELVGGLYGVAIGRVFFGESMFSLVSDASKVAFVHALRHLERRGFALVDCQIWSPHMESLGATLIERDRFLDSLNDLCTPARAPGSWSEDFQASGTA
jgi:leucyl/phenylalanyl-tRNA--protein transferase